MTWEIFVGITVVFGFIMAVAKPAVNIAKMLGELNQNLTNLKEIITNVITENTENHKQIWKSIDEAHKELDDHEKRLVRVETEIKFFKSPGYNLKED